MTSVQTVMKELRTLKQEETTMINLASKVSDQLNRLKVEELALQNMVRLQNEELERRSRASQRSINISVLGGDELEAVNENYSDNESEVVPLDLYVNNKFHGLDQENMEEEEEEEEEDDEPTLEMEVNDFTEDPEDIEQFVNSL